LFFILVITKDKLTDLWLLQNDFKNTLSETKTRAYCAKKVARSAASTGVPRAYRQRRKRPRPWLLLERGTPVDASFSDPQPPFLPDSPFASPPPLPPPPGFSTAPADSKGPRFSKGAAGSAPRECCLRRCGECSPLPVWPHEVRRTARGP